VKQRCHIFRDCLVRFYHVCPYASVAQRC